MKAIITSFAIAYAASASASRHLPAGDGAGAGGMNIYWRHDSQPTECIPVGTASTVGDAKALIAAQLGWPQCLTQLSVGGKVLNEDDVLLADQGVSAEAVIDVVRITSAAHASGTHIHWRRHGSQPIECMPVEQTSTVADVKTLIAWYLRWQPCEVHLLIGDRVLQDDAALLTDEGIDAKSLIDVIDWTERLNRLEDGQQVQIADDFERGVIEMTFELEDTTFILRLEFNEVKIKAIRWENGKPSHKDWENDDHSAFNAYIIARGSELYLKIRDRRQLLLCSQTGIKNVKVQVKVPEIFQ